jgi:NDP-sugar pyrophosphorylase family protein
VLVCPERQDAVAALAETAPLANAPILGQSLIECWLVHLAMRGVKEVRVLAADRPEQVRALVGNGERWGLRVEVLPESRELLSDNAALMDHLPGLPELPLFTSYADWFAAVQSWMPHAPTPDRIGVREIKPGVWAGLRARISPDAELRAPCWIGEDVRVATGAVIGPHAVLEDRSVVERGAEVSESIVGPETFVGRFTELRDAIACGSTLVNWRLHSTIQVPDAFLLCSLARRHSDFRWAEVFSRAAAAMLSSPQTAVTSRYEPNHEIHPATVRFH